MFPLLLFYFIFFLPVCLLAIQRWCCAQLHASGLCSFRLCVYFQYQNYLVRQRWAQQQQTPQNTKTTPNGAGRVVENMWPTSFTNTTSVYGIIIILRPHKYLCLSLSISFCLSHTEYQFRRTPGLVPASTRIIWMCCRRVCAYRNDIFIGRCNASASLAVCPCSFFVVASALLCHGMRQTSAVVIICCYVYDVSIGINMSIIIIIIHTYHVFTIFVFRHHGHVCVCVRAVRFGAQQTSHI